MARCRWKRRSHDRGETLIEILVTIVVIGITIPAIMGAVLLSVAVSTQDRRQVQAQALLASWGETIARENSTDLAYASCVGLSFYSTAPYLPVGVPTGFTASVVSINYWDTATGAYLSTCPVTDPGLRRVQLKVSVPAGLYPAFDVTQTVVVRKLCLAC